MANSPRLKIYTAHNEYIGCCKYAEDAAVLVAAQEGGSVRYGHKKSDTVWQEDKEDFPAGESYDRAATIMWKRVYKLGGMLNG